MKLVIIIGAGAVGKMTVGQELAKITDLRLFHNHVMIEPVLEVFGRFDIGIVVKLRDVIFREFAKSELYGMIFTYLWVFDKETDWADRSQIDSVCEIFKEVNAEIYCAELVASKEVRLQRNATENRLLHKASKRDIEKSNQFLIDEEIYRCESSDGEIPFENYIKIDNSNLEPDVVAGIIKERFSL